MGYHIKLAVAAIAAAFATLSLAADMVSVGGYTWHYSQDRECVVIMGVSPSAGDISIPESLTVDERECVIVSIAESAFAESTGLTGIEIPYSVTNVESRAFANCSALSCVTVLNPSAKIADDAFSGCAAIAAAILPQSLTDSAETIFSDSSSVSVYRADRIDGGAPRAVMRTAKMTGFRATSTPDVCKFTLDTKLENGVDAAIDTSNIRVLRAATVEEVAALPESAASQDAIAGDIKARDTLAVKLRVRVDPSGDGDIPVAYGEDETPEAESSDKRYFNVTVED